MTGETVSLGAPDWLTATATRQVIAALEAARPGGSRFVGGCVRNTLMGRAVDDVDIATQLTPDAVMAALEAADIRAIPTGLSHGTVTALCADKPFEITSLRRDIETDGRHAVVAFTEDWREDARRRDFRLNALYAEPDGRLHDPNGGGVADALAGRVVFIGDGDDRLREDYLRILRFFRFNAWYGAGVDADGLAACERQRGGLSGIAAERIWKELKRLLAAPSPSSALFAMQASGVLEAVLTGAQADAVIELERVEAACGGTPDPMRRLMAMLTRRARDVTAAAVRLRLSNAEAARLLAWTEPALEALDGGGASGVRAAIYRYGAEAVRDRMIVGAAVTGGDVADEWLAVCDGWAVPDFPVTGGDALARGLSGPALGAALRRVEDWWIAQDFVPDRAALLARLV